MTNLKTSQLDDANTPLSGSEIVGIVQEGLNVKTTTLAIGASAFDNTYVTIGENASRFSESNYTVALGYTAYAGSNQAVAVGAHAQANAQRSVAIGYATTVASGANYAIAIGNAVTAYGNSSVVIGRLSYASEYAGIAIGIYAKAVGNSAIVIGNYSYAKGNNSIAIGYDVKVKDQDSISIGNRSYTKSKSVAIGFKAYTGNASVSIGYDSGSKIYNYAVSIGAKSNIANDYGVAVGYQAIADRAAVAIGYESHATDVFSVALGANCYAQANYAIAIGKSTAAGTNSVAIGGAKANYSGSIVMGMNAQDVAIGSFVVRGVYNGSLSPTDHYQKFIGYTSSSGPTSSVLTSDGNSFTSSSFNTPAIPITSFATLTARVCAVDSSLFAEGSPSNTATFVLSTPSLIYRPDSGTYTIVGTPTFVIENYTVGASAWPVPTLTIDSDTGDLIITVSNTTEAALYWMAHVKMDCSS